MTKGFIFVTLFLVVNQVLTYLFYSYVFASWQWYIWFSEISAEDRVLFLLGHITLSVIMTILQSLYLWVVAEVAND